jgi:PAS domain S-box-containing protein
MLDVLREINILPPEEVEALRRLALKNQQNRFVFPHRLASAEIRTVEVYTSPIKQNRKTILFSIIHDITDKKRAQEALRKSEERYRTVADFNYDWEYWVDAEGNFLYCSPSCERVTGYLAQEFLDDPELMTRIIHTDDRAEMMNHYHNVRKVNPEAEDSTNFRIIHRNGAIRWIGHVCQQVHDQEGRPIGRRGGNRDITERKWAEELLHNTIQRYHKILSSMYAGVLLVSEDGYVEYVNQAFCDLFDLDDPPVNLQGLSAPDMIHKIQAFYADPAYAVNHIQTIVTQGLPIRGEEIAMADARICMVDYVPILIEGKSGGRLWLHYDITDRKRIEKEKEKLIIELQDALSEVKKLSGFLSICSSCKKIRDDKGYWQQVEEYISDHSEALFSHGICPDCMRKLYPEIADEVLGRLEKDEKK